jgi:hypothetical protein
VSSHVVVCTIKCRVSGIECHGDGAIGQDGLLLMMLRKQVSWLNQSVLEYVILCLGVCNSCVYLFVFNISENFTNRGHFLSDTKQRNEEIYFVSNMFLIVSMCLQICNSLYSRKPRVHVHCNQL